MPNTLYYGDNLVIPNASPNEESNAMSHISDPQVWRDFVSEQIQNPQFADAHAIAKAELRLGIALARASESPDGRGVMSIEAHAETEMFD
jgi:hypothetical protein